MKEQDIDKMILEEIKNLLASGNTAEQHLIALDRRLEVKIRQIREERAAEQAKGPASNTINKLETKRGSGAPDSGSGTRYSAGAEAQPRQSNAF